MERVLSIFWEIPKRGSFFQIRSASNSMFQRRADQEAA